MPFSYLPLRMLIVRSRALFDGRLDGFVDSLPLVNPHIGYDTVIVLLVCRRHSNVKERRIAFCFWSTHVARC